MWCGVVCLVLGFDLIGRHVAAVDGIRSNVGDGSADAVSGERRQTAAMRKKHQ